MFALFGYGCIILTLRQYVKFFVVFFCFCVVFFVFFVYGVGAWIGGGSPV